MEICPLSSRSSVVSGALSLALAALTVAAPSESAAKSARDVAFDTCFASFSNCVVACGPERPGNFSYDLCIIRCNDQLDGCVKDVANSGLTIQQDRSSRSPLTNSR